MSNTYDTIPINATTPFPIKLDFRCAVGAFDLMTATGARYDYQRADQTTGSWTCTVSKISSEHLLLSYLPIAGDLPKSETILIRAVVVIPSGEVPAKVPVQLVVEAKFP